MTQSIQKPHAGASDGEILTEFLDHGRQDSFARIVDRHGKMVLGVCRSVLGNTPDAEDAAQAVFLTLAHKASSVKGHKTLVGWLHRVAWYVAARAAEARAIRLKHEQEAARMRPEQQQQHPDIPLDQLHGAIEKLPDKYRIALLLHHLEGRTQEETAALLGCTVSTASMRLNRGRQMLRERMVKGGAVVTAAAVVGMLSGKASAALPATFIASTARVAASLVAGKAATATTSASIAALSKAAANMLFWAKLKIAAAVTLGVFLLAGAGSAYIAMAREPARKVSSGTAAQPETAPQTSENAAALLTASQGELQGALDELQRAVASNKGGNVESAITHIKQAMSEASDAVAYLGSHPDENTPTGDTGENSTVATVAVPAYSVTRDAAGNSNPRLAKAIGHLNAALGAFISPPGSGQLQVGPMGGYRDKILADINNANSDILAAYEAAHASKLQGGKTNAATTLP